ncbi:AAA family ATPase [Cylindrospermum sp. FACHB-282]|uniref:AAA family ATPase n=1 Tax=Cylindrospermum sp. FACHB-282 TaxID=2692794 RepID=UPI0016852CC9|nr:AAA family ATPase [Cylindrospermum sp. FACHB-282]MBD2388666.1 AAA family ATPase [Cylindrospermum sp. FACHB-282]
MSKEHPTAKLWIYLAECVRLLYWSYFKPYTFERWLRDIHPELKPTDHAFDKRAEFRTNPRLRHYAGQVWWLTAIVPTLAVLVVAPIYTLASGETFNWVRSCPFLLGWLIGLIVARGNNKTRLVTFCFAFLTSVFTSRFLSGVASDVASGVAGGVVGGVAGGVVFGVGLGVTGGVAFGVVGGVAFGVVFGVVGGVTSGVGLGVALGVVGCVVGILTAGVTGGQAVSMAWLLAALRFYFWLPELLWILTLFFLSRIGIQINYLRYLPPRFDEVIILPLPFMGQMIVESYRDHPTATRETIDYLISSTNQQKVAAQAILEIGRDIFSRCQRLSDIVELTHQLTWIRSPAPKEYGTVLPQFLDICQGVRAADEATSPYRKYELLNIPIKALGELKNSLAFGTNAAVATMFGSTAERWLTILETAQRNLAQQALQSKEISQVYIAGNSLDPETAKSRFKGRIDIFREIENFTLSEQPPVLLLYGGRRTGKTSALKYLPYKIVPNIVPLLVDLQGAASATTLQGLAENLAKQIIEAARRLPRSLDLPYPNAAKLAKDPFPALQIWLGEIERSYPGKQFLLCLDEFERLSEVVEVTKSFVPLNFLRNLLQHQQKWTLLFSGSHQLSELPDYWSDYLINTRALRMSYLEESEARELILHPVEGFRQIYELRAVDEIIQLTGCQPFLVQLVCYELVELLNGDIRGNRREPDTAKVTVEDVELIIPQVLERGDQYFRELWKSLSESDRNFLKRLIYGETPTQQDKGVVKRLVRKEILNPEANAFQVPLVQRFVELLLEEE